MIIPNSNINEYINKNTTPNFSSRNSIIRDTDDICRRVIREFPVTSNTKMEGYKNISTLQNMNYLNYVRSLMSTYREYYNRSGNVKQRLLKEISGMKNLNIGNCAELSDATYIALKLNGAEDVKLLLLYAYNTATENMRNLDHCVVGINFRLPKNYKYHQWDISERHIEPECRIYPQKDSIIADTWAGFVEYGNNADKIYKINRALIENSKSDLSKTRKGLLYDKEELCYVPIEDSYKLQDKDLEYFQKTYPSLIKDKNKKPSPSKVKTVFSFVLSLFQKKEKDITQKRTFRFSKISPEIKEDLKYQYSLKGTLTEKEMKTQKKDHINSVYKKYKIK